MEGYLAHRYHVQAPTGDAWFYMGAIHVADDGLTLGRRFFKSDVKKKFFVFIFRIGLNGQKSPSACLCSKSMLTP